MGEPVTNWKRRCEQMGDERAAPEWATGVPMCSEDACALYDGKRCRALGCRPGNICEPAVANMADIIRGAPVGEPVTEEMLASVERMCGVEYFPGDDVRAIVAAAHAAGYARAERDVVAFVRRAAETHRDAAEFAGVAAEGVLVDAEALDLAATGIEQGAHRGAAKEGT